MPAFSPYHRINQVPIHDVQQYLKELFQLKGHPGAIRVDNGEPLGSPKKGVTTALALWLIGSGIKMIWNRPFSPKDNAKVERNQDTTWRWSEIAKAQSYAQAQQKLNEAVRIQREQYPVTRLNRKTRAQAYPALCQKAREWNPGLVDSNNVYQFLAQKVFTRKVSQAGQINLFGRKCTVESKCKGQYVQLKMDPQKKVWIIYDQQDQKIKEQPTPYFSTENIINLTVFKKE